MSGAGGPGKPIVGAAKATNVFKGLSVLREEERRQQAAPVKNAALTEYLKKYTSGDDIVDGKKKKKKKKPAADGGAVKIIDNDVTGFGGPSLKTRVAQKLAQASEDEDEECESELQC